MSENLSVTYYIDFSFLTQLKRESAKILSCMAPVPLGFKTYVAGRIAADTLGFIGGNLPGAIAADVAFANHYEVGKRGHSTYPTPPRTPTKKHRKGDLTLEQLVNLSPMPKKLGGRKGLKKVKGKTAKRSWSVSVRKQHSKPPQKAGGITDAGVKQVAQHSKRVLLKKHKLPSVTKKFKQAVEAALSPNMLKGTYHTLTLDQGLDLTLLTEDRQYCFDTINNPNLDGAMLFTPDYFLDAVQRLWMGTTTAYAAGYLKPNQAGYNYANRKFHCIDSYATFEYKNNSQRVISLKIYECAPKRKGAYLTENPYAAGFYDNLGVAAAAQKDPMWPPLKAWTDALNQDFVLGYSSAGTGGALSNAIIGLTPTSSKTFNNLWKTNLVQVRLLPGQVYKLKVQGPSDIEVDYEKFNMDSIYQNVQKFSRGIIHIVNVDMTDGTLGGSARTVPSNLSNGGVPGVHPQLSIERQDHFRFQMPDRDVPLASRQDRYIRANVFSGAAYGGQIEVDMENPALPA